MSAPDPLDPVPDPEWIGEPLTGKGAAGDTGEADGTATGADMGGLGGTAGGLGDGVGFGFDALGGGATAVSQYKQSTAQLKGFKIADAALGGLADVMMGKSSLVGVPDLGAALVPVVDSLFVKPVFKLMGIDFSVGDTVTGTVRTLVTVTEGITTDTREGMARLRTRADMGEMGSLAKQVSRLVSWLRS
jgi:hypothetical protein